MKGSFLMRSFLALLIGMIFGGVVQAQTATDPNEGSRLTYNGLLGSYTFSWWGQSGRTYFLQHSSDLSAWEYLPLIESGTNGLLSWGFTSTAPKFLLRLRFVDFPTTDPLTADFDGDKVGNWDELLHSTDPLVAADTDSNGLPDDWETFYFGHVGVDPNATAPGGGMTNQQHFDLGSNPNNPPPPPTLTAGPATLDLSADTLLYPANDTGLLIQNGNFSQPALGTSNWFPYPGIPHWTALDFGTLIELQQFSSLALAGQYCELDAHWPTADHSGAPDHGLQQNISLARGQYLLLCDYRARSAGADSFTVKLQSAGSSTETPLFTKNAALTTAWKRAAISFKVTGGNPNLSALPMTLLFDELGARDSYGPYIDNVLLLPVEFEEVYPASGFDKYTEPNWLMVPKDQTNWAKAITPANTNLEIKFKAVPGPGGATVTPDHTNQSPETIGVSSPTVGDDSSAVIGIGTAYGTEGLKLAVKKYRHKTVAIHAVTQRYTTPMPLQLGEGKPNLVCVQGGGILWSTPGGDDQPSGQTITTGANGVCETTADPRDTQIIPAGQGICKDLVPQGVPSASNFETYINHVFGLQANIYFTVSRSDAVVDYDTTQPRNKMLDMTGLRPVGPEETTLQNGAATIGADINIYFVYEFNYGATTIGKALSPDIAYVDAKKSGSLDLQQVAAHEIGHDLGISFHANLDFRANPAYLKGKDSKRRLMYEVIQQDTDNVLIKAEWDLINKNNLP